MLFFDFRFQGHRCREYTLLQDSDVNRKKMEKVLKRIEMAIVDGSFRYEEYFPNSKMAARLAETKPTSIEVNAADCIESAEAKFYDRREQRDCRRFVGVREFQSGSSGMPVILSVYQFSL